MTTNGLLGLGASLVLAVGVAGDKVRAVEGYEAIGYLTYTSFNPSGKAAFKRVIMFDVKVGKTWHIRTEPVVECNGGIGFQESVSCTNNCIWSVTALEAAYKASDSPFQRLRNELKESKKEDVYFTNPTLQPPEWAARSSSEKAAAPSVNNVAIATGLTGMYPPMDPSYAGFLWFAFTPPSKQADGTNQMLLQIWDDGNPLSALFRRAKWTQFSELPNLVSSAVYNWVGREFHPDGTVADINVSDVLHPLGTAARYDVEGTTNLSGLVLPTKMRLTRFNTKPAENGNPRVLTTDVAFVTSVRLLLPNETLEGQLPGRTWVSDYRSSAERPNMGPTSYLQEGGALPR